MIQETFPANQWAKYCFDNSVVIEVDRQLTVDVQQGRCKPLAEYHHQILRDFLSVTFPAGNA